MKMERHTLQQRFIAEMTGKERNYRKNESVWSHIQTTLDFLDSIYNDAGIMSVQFMDDSTDRNSLNICAEMKDMSLGLRDDKKCVAGLLSADAIAFEQNKEGNLLVTFRFNDLWVRN